MFGPRFGRFSRYPHGRRGGGGNGNLGLLLLAFQIMQTGIDNIPLVTLGTLCLNCAIYLRFPPNWIVPLGKACVGFTQVWYLKEWKRLLLSPWYHTSDMHLYYNMSSLIWKGRKLELKFGPITFAVTLALFCFLSPLITVGLSFAAAEILEDVSYLSQCAAGFSGVLFALKVLVSYYESERSFTTVMFFTVPTRMAFWLELVLIQILVPNVSFVGHLAGILTGLLYVKGPLKPVVKSASRLIESIWYGQPNRRSFHSSGTTGGYHSNSRNNSNYHNRDRTSYNRSEPYAGGMSDQEQTERAMRDSMTSHHQSQQRNSNVSANSRMYPDLSGYRYEHEPSAPPPPEYDDPNPGSTIYNDEPRDNYPDIGFVRQQRLNRYT